MYIWQRLGDGGKHWERPEQLEFDINVDDDEINDLNDEDALHHNDGLADNSNADIENIGVINEYDNQHNYFGATDDNIQHHNHHFGRKVQRSLDTDDKDDNDNGHFNVVGDEESSANNNNDKFHDSHQHGSDSYYNSGNESDSDLRYHDHNTNVNWSDEDSDAHSNDLDEVADPVTRSRLPGMVRGIGPRGNDDWPDGGYWTHTYTCPMLSAMMVAEQVGVRMMKEYFEIEASESTPQYGFRKGFKLFGDEEYQTAKNELKVNLLGRGWIDILSWKDITWDTRKQALGYLMFLKRKWSGKMKGVHV